MHVSRVLVGPWGSYRFQQDFVEGVEQLVNILTPEHEYIAADLPTIAREAELGENWTPQEAFDEFIKQTGLLKSPEDVPASAAPTKSRIDNEVDKRDKWQTERISSFMIKFAQFVTYPVYLLHYRF